MLGGADAMMLGEFFFNFFSPPTMASVTPVFAFISISTFLLLRHHGSRRTDALERSRTVDAIPAVAEAGDRLALVDVHALAGVDVLQETLLAVESCRTPLTRVTPCNTWSLGLKDRKIFCSGALFLRRKILAESVHSTVLMNTNNHLG